jgi:TRAP-type C4-dicarboxylate transport system substrate-binding protein
LNNEKFIPADANLNRCNSAALAAAAALMQHLTADTQHREAMLLTRALDTGGRVGIEVLTNAALGLSVALIAQGRDGECYLIAKATNDTKGYREAADTALDLIMLMDSDQPPATREALYQLAENGGCFGVELLVDQHARTYTALIAIDPEGTRRTVARVVTIGQHPATTTLH